ncbi:hypothetical protein LGQ02_10285 [Bacillus shivajii]|uniref:hypothetical protein n=1 Tax=Bacillus shivajii TaxID=1983719 RepID=UPI001CFA5622|nr:hypothetical protein [Bacillus shivajii]UCZ55080.1 hypothetical protein LGQ02_10285 [Bacillus shivajii]
MFDLLIKFQLEAFVIAEIVTVISILLFLFLRYATKKQTLSFLFLSFIILATIFEAFLVWLVYQETGEISTIQIVIIIFIIYAFTFGIHDFKRLDRKVKKLVGNWRGVQLLTEKDLIAIEKSNDPKYVAITNRRWWYIHLMIYIGVQSLFWFVYGINSMDYIEFLTALFDFSNITLLNNEFVAQVSTLWSLIFIIDTIYSLSYTIFPKKIRKIKTVSDSIEFRMLLDTKRTGC